MRRVNKTSLYHMLGWCWVLIVMFQEMDQPVEKLRVVSSVCIYHQNLSVNEEFTMYKSHQYRLFPTGWKVFETTHQQKRETRSVIALAHAGKRGTRITPELLVGLPTRIIGSGEAFSGVFGEECSQGDVWRAATRFCRVPKAGPARSDRGFQSAALLGWL